ncbi:MAG: virulence RhuM family protein [Clostridiales bacterium]|nr:virulence RhuM family protein [Clostridiales bacterium]
MEDTQKGEILIYKTERGDIKVDAYFSDEMVWLSQASIARLYQTTPQNIIMHTRNIYKEGELEEQATCKNYLQVQTEGSRAVKRSVKYYSLDMILAIGYRVRSHIGIQFRNWATEILSEYMKKGFAVNDARLKNPKPFGADYFDELLERIRDIRASEKRLYQKVRDIYALSVDYDSRLESTKSFFATVQNKLHYAVHGMTAAELITSRASSEKENMGLTTYAGSIVRQDDVTIAKNYLSQTELEDLNRIVTMFLDHAEDMARQHTPMYMKDWEASLNAFLTFRKRNILQGGGKVSSADMERKVLAEYAIFNTQRLKTTKLDIENEENSIDELKGSADC